MKKISDMTLEEIRNWRPAKLTEDDIREIVDTVVAASDPEMVILFGSYARGDATPESDLDLLVVKETDVPRAQRATNVRRALSGVPCAVDVVVATPAELQRSRGSAFTLTGIANDEGSVLYER